ncbi:MAG: MarR family transcriptional regulator [Clostridia bacterium]|nr:MarR family transcriptional regulator [Clostridia bacterium]
MLTYLLIKVSRYMKTKMDQSLKSIALTSSQFSVMNQIDLMGNRGVANEIAEQLGSDRPTISGIISRLEKLSYIEKFKNDYDRRSEFIKLTHLGQEKLKEARKIADALSSEFFKAFSIEEKEKLEKQMLFLVEKLER